MQVFMQIETKYRNSCSKVNRMIVLQILENSQESNRGGVLF